MSDIIQFPQMNKPTQSAADAFIEAELQNIPEKERVKLRFELVKTLDSYDKFFTEWSLTLPENSDATLKKQIYDISHQEHERKMLMLRDIMRLKIQVLVAEYQLQKP